MTVEPGQVYRAVRANPGDPRMTHRRIRIERWTPGHNHAWVVDAQTGKRARWILVSALHATPITKTGQPRRTGYALETT